MKRHTDFVEAYFMQQLVEKNLMFMKVNSYLEALI